MPPSRSDSSGYGIEFRTWDGNAPELLSEVATPIALGGGVNGAAHDYGGVLSVKDSDILVNVIFTAPGANTRTAAALLTPGGTPSNGAIGGTILMDSDQDGDVADPDLPAPGVSMELLARDAAGNPTGPVLKTSTSIANGTFAFDEMPAGSYIVRGALTPAQAAGGLSWTSPAITASAVTKTAVVTGGATTANINFLVATPIRPDHSDDENDGDIGLGRQSLREALARASLKSGPASLTTEGGSALLPAVQKLADAVNYQFALDERYTDLRYVVQTSDGAAPWFDATTFVPLGGGNGFRRQPAPGSLTTAGSSSSDRSRFLVNELLPIQPGQQQLLRLKVASAP